MKSIKEIRNEISGEHFNLRDLDEYMVKAGYHSNLPDADLAVIGKDEAIIYLGKEEESEVTLDLLITRWAAFADAFCAVVTDVREE